MSAASSGGPRYDPSLTAEQRRASDNGIWLCQNCAKLADSDVSRYTIKRLRAWKDEAEEVARIQLEAPEYDVDSTNRLARANRLAPQLMEEMREDLRSSPFMREFVLLRKGWVFNSSGDALCYYYDQHADLDNLMHIFENLGLVREVTTTNVKRYRMSEELADYLTR
jgi:hypothetical protein